MPILPRIAVLATLALAPGGATAEVVLHYFGARDCPPCAAFARAHLPGVRAIGAAAGFAVEAHVIDSLRDMGAPGAFGSADPLLRAALGGGAAPYPPVFAVTRDGALLSTHGPDWGAALLAARDAE